MFTLKYFSSPFYRLIFLFCELNVSFAVLSALPTSLIQRLKKRPGVNEKRSEAISPVAKA